MQDAEKAVDLGIDGIVVSNHGEYRAGWIPSVHLGLNGWSGGRQVDGSIGALDALDMVMQSSKVREAQSTGKFTVLFDSGIRTGSDILKALALGAQAVLSTPLFFFFFFETQAPTDGTVPVGRPFMYGLAIAGEAGVEQILMQTIADLHITMGLCGFGDIRDVVGAREKLMVKINQ